MRTFIASFYLLFMLGLNTFCTKTQSFRLHTHLSDSSTDSRMDQTRSFLSPIFSETYAKPSNTNVVDESPPKTLHHTDSATEDSTKRSHVYTKTPKTFFSKIKHFFDAVPAFPLFTGKTQTSNSTEHPTSFHQRNCTKYSAPTPSPPSNAKDLYELGLSTFQIDLFQQHNTYRENVGIPPLEWDKDLEKFITEYIIRLDVLGGCEIKHSQAYERTEVGNFSNIGENLYSRWGTTAPLPGNRPAEAWYNEIYCYRYGKVGDPCTEYPNPVCQQEMGFTSDVMVGHFTQLMWDSATHVGCAGIQCGASYDGPGDKHIVGCSYGSGSMCYGGNIWGEYPFSVSVAQQLNVAMCPLS